MTGTQRTWRKSTTQKIAIVQEYLENYQTISGDQAESYLRRRATVEEDMMQVRLKYLREFRAGVSQGANGSGNSTLLPDRLRLDLMINLQLAQAPVINP
jgi:hypothetical protein